MSCTLDSAAGYWDLSKLQAKTDYVVTTPTGRNFSLNVCTHTQSDTWALDEPETVAGFFRSKHADFSIGSVNSSLLLIGGNPVLVYQDGSPCPKSNAMKASSVLRFICDTSVSGNGQPQLIAQLPLDDDASCFFTFEWRTRAACPTSKPGSGSSFAVFFAVLAIALLVYPIATFAYNRYKGLRGAAQFPSLACIPRPSDCLAFIRSLRSGGQQKPSWGSWRDGGRLNGYSPVSAEEEEALAGENDRFSLEADQESPDERPIDGPLRL